MYPPKELLGARSNPRALDFCSGSGVIGAAIQAQLPAARLTLLDADAVALVAARSNVPGAAVILSGATTPSDCYTFPYCTATIVRNN